jgi:CRP-like cAMP-binding protein
MARVRLGTTSYATGRRPSPLRSQRLPVFVHRCELRLVAAISLHRALGSTGWFTPDELATLLSRFERRPVRRKEHVLRSGELCKAVLYVEQGCFRAYTTGRDLKESVLWFATEDWWLSDLDSLFNRTPAGFDIQALEDGMVQAIAREDFLGAMERYPAFKEGHVRKVRRSQQAMLQRLNSLRLMNADERYAALLLERPELLLRVPLQHIASYLDLEPQTLSKVRARLGR